MRLVIERFALALAAVALLASAGSSAPSTAAIAGLLAIALLAVDGVRYAASRLRAHELGVGGRAREHRQLLAFAPAPSHPDTAGRTRSRAPARPIAAA
ncbi:MAG TPA: hypothetical protein VGM94_16610 [Galbitalea sp.]